VIQEEEYKKRRDKLSKKLLNYSVGIISASSYKTRSNDTQYPYRQNSNFYYLSGFKEDNTALVFVKRKKSIKTILFVQAKDKVQELWNGKRLGEKKAKKRFLVDEVYTMREFDSKLKEFIGAAKNLYYDFDSEDKSVQLLKPYVKAIQTNKNIAPLIHKMRLIKSSAEIQEIKKAIHITKKAHHQAMNFSKIGKKEYMLQAEIEYTFKSHGAYSDAYTSIVACGNSANTLHYIENNRALVENALILIDAGCEYDYYASDITRTIPVSGQFTQPQKELYNMILEVQLKIIKMVKPHAKRSDLQQKAQELLCRGMLELKILKGNYKKLMKKEAYKKYYPHGIGHWMGIDVHDEAPYKDENGNEIAFAKGMVLTIEPGIYIDKDDKKVPKKYRGIGIRIEDDILVTKRGYKNLSAKIAKSVKEIESISSDRKL